MFDLEAIKQVITSGKRLVIYLHDNPDPDSIAGGWLLSRLAESLGRRAVILYGGRLGRAENRTMVRVLRIPLRHLDKTRLRRLKTDRYALVDTQPGTGNNSFPHDKLPCHIVIDHHPARKATRAKLVDIRPEQGCSTTLVLEYTSAAGMEMSPDLATAVAYAIISETQDLGREASRADREAYARAFPLMRLRLLGRIRHPARTRDYFRTIARAMSQVLVARNTCICHIGEVDEAEVVAEVADFLAAMDRITWCLATGRHRDQMILSMRATRPRAQAERVMRRMLGRVGKGGGHGMIAGGLIPLENPDQYAEQARRVSERFLNQIHRGRQRTELLRPLLGDEAQPPDDARVPPSALAPGRKEDRAPNGS